MILWEWKFISDEYRLHYMLLHVREGKTAFSLFCKLEQTKQSSMYYTLCYVVRKLKFSHFPFYLEPGTLMSELSTVIYQIISQELVWCFLSNSRMENVFLLDWGSLIDYWSDQFLLPHADPTQTPAGAARSNNLEEIANMIDNFQVI